MNCPATEVFGVKAPPRQVLPRLQPPRWWVAAPWVLAAVVAVRAAHGQSLLERTPEVAVPRPLPEGVRPAQVAREAAPTSPASALEGVSLYTVTAPKPRTWAKHDLVEIIINESSVQKLAQTNDLKKNLTLEAELSQFPSLSALFKDFSLRNGIGTPPPSVGVSSDNKYKGEAKLDRKDQFTAKMTAEIVDVKPNGTLVLEAKETIQTDREISTMVISGVCRGEDISKSNTVQSSQLANLVLRVEHEGDVKNTADKGLITRVLETLFNF